MTLDECFQAFDQEIFQQDTASWLLLILGVLIVLSALFVFMTKELQVSSLVVLLLVGGAFVFATRTGQIPFLSGTLKEPSLSTVKLRETHRAVCIERELAEASDIPDGIPVEIVRVAENISSDALANVASKADATSLVWIFYNDNRKAEAERLGELLISIDVTAIVEADDFAQVINKQPAGTTRIIYSDDRFTGFSEAIAELASAEEFGASVVLQGPYSSIVRGPVQLQLY